MSLDLNRLVREVKKAAVAAVQAQKPMAYYLGEVVSISPIKISVDQKLTLTDKQLILTSAVKNFSVKVAEKKNGVLQDEKEYMILLGLKVGEKVRMYRCDGGQKFVVFDRVEVSS